MVLRTPRLRGLAFGPLLAALAVFIVLGIVVGTVAANQVSTAFHISDGPLIPLGQAAFVVLWLVLFPFLFTGLAGVFYPFVFERLSLATEETLAPGESLPALRPSLPSLVGDTLGRIAFNAALTLAALLLSLFFPLGPVPWGIAAGIITLLDCSAPAFQRRGILFGGQLRALLFPPQGSVLAFILIAGFLALLPFIGVLCLPGLVAGATRLTQNLRKDTHPPP